MSLKQTIVSAVGWFFAITVSVQIVTWAMTLVVIRILSPDDYGLMAVSQIFVNFMLGFGSLGFGDALVQQSETPRTVVACLFGVPLVAPLQPITAGIIMMGAVMAVRLTIAGALPEVVTFGALVAVGAATYCGVLFGLFRGLAMEVLQIFRRAPSPTG